MRVDPPNFQTRNRERTKRPRFVVELAFDSDNEVLRYFTSHSDVKVGYAMKFDGVKQHVTVPDEAAFKYTGGNLSMECWVEFDPNEMDQGALIAKPWNGGGYYNYWLQEYYGHSLQLTVGGATTWNSNPTAALSVGVPHHVVAVLKSDRSVIIYVDGAEALTSAHDVASWTPGGGGDANQALTFGCQSPYGEAFAGNVLTNYGGKLDGVRMYSRVLSPDEVVEHMAGVFENESGLLGIWHFDENIPNSRVVIDSSGNKRHGTMQTGVISKVPALKSAAILSSVQNLSSTSQSLNPDKAVATIGNTSFDLIDKNGEVTRVLADQIQLGRSNRLQRSRVFMGYEGLEWKDFALLPMTQFVSNISYHQGSYGFSCTDIQREMRKEIFTDLRTTLSLPIKKGDASITVASTAGFQLVEHGAGWSDAPGKTCLYVRVEDEVIRCTAIPDATHLTIDPGGGRGVLNTREVEHLIDTTVPIDRRTQVQEHIYIELPALKAAYALLTGQLYGQSFLRLPGISGNYASTPHSAANTVTGDLDVRARVSLDDWTPAGECYVFSKGDATHRSWIFGVGTGGNLLLYLSTDGTNWLDGGVPGHYSSVVVGFADGSAHWIRATRASGSGTITYYTSEDYDPNTDTGTWTQLGTTVASTAGALFATDSVLTVWGWDALRAGNAYYAELRSGIGATGTRVAEFDPNRFVDAELTAIMSTGETWTVSQSGGTKAEITHRVLPSHWHLGIPKKYVRTADYINKVDIWNVWDEEASFPARSEALSRTDGKQFIESQLMLLVGCFMSVYSDGALGCKRMVNILSGAAYVKILDDRNLVGPGSPLKWDFESLHNVIDVDWNWEWLRKEYTRQRALVDLASIAMWNRGSLLRYQFQTLHGSRHSEMILKQQFNWLRDRYSSPPIRCTRQVLPSLNPIEIGDVVRLRDVHVRDFVANTDVLDRSMEVQSASINWMSGEVSLSLFGSSRKSGPLPPLGDSVVLSDAFYSSKGQPLSSFVTITGSNPAHITAGGNLPGAEDLTSDAAIYYYDGGDLVLDEGVVITINKNVQIRVKGFFSRNGTIDGAGRGYAGGAALTSFPAVSDVWAGARYQNLGTKGFVGNTQSGGGFVAPRSSPIETGTPESFAVGEPPILEGSNTAVPELNLQYDGAVILGLPKDLRGTSGSSGFNIFPANSDHSAFGGFGGASGAGLLIICRGAGAGVAGKVDLSGKDGGLGGITQYEFQVQGSNPVCSFHAGSGAGGTSGACLVLLDGALVTETGLTDEGFISLQGKTPIPAKYIWPDDATGGFVFDGQHFRSRYAGTGDGSDGIPVPGSPPGGNLAYFRVQHIPGINAPEVDPLDPDFEVLMQEVQAANWFKQANPKDKTLFDACWVDFLQKWCAVGEADGTDAYMLTADENGEPWTEQSNPQNVSLNGVAASPSLAVVVGEVVSATRPYIATSTTLSSWTQRNPTVDKSLALYAVTYFDKVPRWVAVGGFQSGSPPSPPHVPYILTSDDGTTAYTERTSPVTYPLFDVACNSSTLIAVGGDPTHGAIIRSTDGITWGSITSPVAKPLNSVVWLERQKLWVASSVGANNKIVVSRDDGLTWVEATHDIAAAGWLSASKDILLTTHGTDWGVYTSRDGGAWTKRSAATYPFSLYTMAWSGHRFLGVGTSTGTADNAILLLSLSR